MQLEVIDRFLPELDDIAARSRHATFYHSGAWIESLIAVFPGIEFHCIIARRDDGAIAGYLPFFVHTKGFARILTSMPFGTYGGPVEVDEPAGESLVDALIAMRRERGVHEVAIVDVTNGIRRRGLHAEENLTHVLSLDPNFETVWTERYDKAKRRQTRKAEREGIRVVQADSVEQVAAYYKIYEERSNEWRQRLRYPEALFTELFTRGRGGVKLFLAYAGDKLLGGHMNFYFRDDVIAWNGVTSKDSRGAQASTLLYSTCIRDACEGGYRHYNLGSSLGKKSLMEYKESLGGERHAYQVVRWRSRSLSVAAALRRHLPGR